MAKKPGKKSSGKRSKTGKMQDLPAKSLGADKAESVKGGATTSFLKIDGTTQLKIDSTLKFSPSSGFTIK